MDSLFYDFRYALRQLLRSPGFTVMAVLTLALGIGANTAIFSVVNGVLLRPLPYPEPDQLVSISTSGMGGRAQFGVSYPGYQDLAALTGSLAGAAAYSRSNYNMTGAGDPRETAGVMVTASLFEVLGARPVLGRVLTAADDREPVALISHRLWQSAYGNDPAVVGRVIRLDNRSYTVVGVMPPTFRFPDPEVELWLPIGWAFAADPQIAVNRGFYAFSAVARLAPGITLERLRADLDILARRNNEAPRGGDGRREVRVEVRGGAPGAGAPRTGGGGAMAGNTLGASSLRDDVVGDAQRALLVLSGAVGLVLLIACANAANLLVARANGRRREIAIRQALGAGRGRLIRQMLTESVTLALAGAAAGVVLAVAGLDLLLGTWPEALPRAAEIGVNGPVLAFALGLSLVTGIAFGLLPAWRASRGGADDALRDETAGGGGRRRLRTQAALVVSEVALALVLLVGAGLLVRSFVVLNSQDPGFEPRNLLSARVRLTPSRYASPEAQRQFFDQLVAALRVHPGVESVTLSRTVPFSGRQMLAINPRTIRPDDPEEFLAMGLSVVGPDFFATLKVPITSGRAFTADDRAGQPPVAIVNQQLAQRLWPGESPLGKAVPGDGPPGEPPATVVGVIGDIRAGNLGDDVGPEIFLPWAQQGRGGSQLWVTARSERPLTLGPVLRDAVRRLDAEQPIGEVVSLSQLIALQQAARRLNTSLVTLFAVLAAILAVVGVYGVTAYAVSQRTREMGVRIALGAGQRDVLRLVIAENLAMVGVGVVGGLALAAFATRWLRSLLFGVGAWDLLTFAGTALLFAGVALVATWIPARRAARVDPVVALRTE